MDEGIAGFFIGVLVAFAIILGIALSIDLGYKINISKTAYIKTDDLQECIDLSKVYNLKCEVNE